MWVPFNVLFLTKAMYFFDFSCSLDVLQIVICVQWEWDRSAFGQTSLYPESLFVILLFCGLGATPFSAGGILLALYSKVTLNGAWRTIKYWESIPSL